MKFIHVGVGGFGKCWVSVLHKNPAAEVVALVDVSDDALAKACETGGYAADVCFKSLDKALKSVKADALVCSTPPAFHKNDVISAMRAGLDVISEKPMSDTMDSCREMLKAARDCGRTYVVSQNYRYSPPMWTLAQTVRSGVLGEIGQVKLDFFKGVDFKGGFRHEMPYPVIIDMSIHHFDLLRFVTGLDAVKVSGAAWNPPWSNYQGDCSSTALFEMNNGARVLYNASWCAQGSFCDWNGNWQIEGDKGTLSYCNGEITLQRVSPFYKVESAEAVEPVPPPLLAQDYILDEFIRCTGSGQQPATSVTDNIRSVGMVFAVVRAMDSGAKVDVLDPETKAILQV